LGSVLQPYESAVAGVLTLTIASEIASKKYQSLGPGSLKSLLVDAIYHITKNDFLSLAKLNQNSVINE